ncbi:MAG: transcriptional regulator [Tissierellaceae bacterium]|jgi:DNA-binding transcriptional regulator of glucitol operon|nr:transcriptional regulator [Tissierellaceae bacterium]
MANLAILAFVLIGVQFGLAYFQFIDYRNKIKELSKKGTIGIGIKKGNIRQGSITILACDEKGIITDCTEMKGRTVFSRFKENHDYIGQNVHTLKNKLENQSTKVKSSLLKAVESIENQAINKQVNLF